MWDDSDEEEALLLLTLICGKCSPEPLPNTVKTTISNPNPKSSKRRKVENKESKIRLENVDPKIGLVPVPSASYASVPDANIFLQFCRGKLSSEYSRHNDFFFQKYFYMTQENFMEISLAIKPKIINKYAHYSFDVTQRLMIYFCHTIMGFHTSQISQNWRCSRKTVVAIITQVARAINDILKPVYMPTPTKETWQESEKAYRHKYKFPYCVGSIGGRCLKTFNSELGLMIIIVVDPNYRINVVDCTAVCVENMNTFEYSSLFASCQKGELGLPFFPNLNKSQPLKLPFVFVGDKTFKLHTFLVTPFKNTATLSKEKKSFNGKLKFAKDHTDTVFKLLYNNFKMFDFACKFECVTDIVKSICVLHNYILIKSGKPSYGTLNQSSVAVDKRIITPISRNVAEPTTEDAIAVRNQFVDYYDCSKWVQTKDSGLWG